MRDVSGAVCCKPVMMGADIGVDGTGARDFGLRTMACTAARVYALSVRSGMRRAQADGIAARGGMEHICQTNLPHALWMHPAGQRLPGLQRLADPHDWLEIDDVYAAQMALRDRLLDTRRGEVLATRRGSGAAISELYACVLDWLAQQDDGFVVGPHAVTRPDGVTVPLETSDPQGMLATLARLVQEDLCILQRRDGADEHVLTAAALCFPASWTLNEKIGRPLTAIHAPVAPYDEALARRVQRLFDHLQVAQPVWRQNALLYEDPQLFQPRREGDPHRPMSKTPGFLRSERQCLRRLPGTGAIVFSIHTYVVPVDRIAPDVLASLTVKEAAR